MIFGFNPIVEVLKYIVGIIVTFELVAPKCLKILFT